MSEERMHILEMIESGKITAEQGMQLLEALNAGDEAADDSDIGEIGGEYSSPEYARPSEAALLLEQYPATSGDPADLPPNEYSRPEYSRPVEPVSSNEYSRSQEPVTSSRPQPSIPPEAAKWRRFWMIPLWVGVGITVLGGYWMYRAQVNASVGWFICASMPFILGVLVLALAWQSRTAPWLHLRVQQKEGERPQRIAFSFPIPVRPTAWFLRTFGHRIQGLKETSVDEVILALGTATSPDNPLYIQVDEGDDEEKVEIYIG